MSEILTLRKIFIRDLKKTGRETAHFFCKCVRFGLCGNRAVVDMFHLISVL